MELNIFSVLMALVLFTVVSLLCSLLLSHTKSNRLWLVGFIMVLCVLRVVVPFEFEPARNVNIWKIFPDIWLVVDKKIIFGLRIWECLGLIWLAGSVILLTRQLFLLGKQLRFNHSVKSDPQDTRLAQITANAAAAVECSAPIRVAVTSIFSSPLMTGFSSPIVLLPEYIMELDDQEIEYVLRHELAHYKKKDTWHKLAIQLLVCLLWWNPAVYRLRQCVNQFLELRCDGLACRSLDDSTRDHYTDTLLSVAKKSSSSPKNLIYSCFTDKFDVIYWMQRINYLTERPTQKNRPLLTALITAVCLLLFVGSYTFIIQPAGLPPEAENSGLFTMSPENSYLVRTDDNRYELWVDGKYVSTVSAETLKIEPFCQLTIYEKEQQP